MILIIDNYDSFTYNLFQAIAELGVEAKVVRNDQISLAEIEKLAPKGIILSPGPGRPEESGICLEILKDPKVPVLGVCLGHQAIGLMYGATVERAPEIVHGKESLVFHNRKKLFKGMPLPFKAGRYHSLVVKNLPPALKADAETPEGLIMALSHVTLPLYGVQFHPESILTPEGKILLKNFVGLCSC